jgi:heme/copper-type cytochrome/quinol oxidase subunit 2
MSGEGEEQVNDALISIVLIVAGLVLLVFFIVVVVTRFYRKVPQRQALIISRARAIEVTFTGALVKPVVDRPR